MVAVATEMAEIEVSLHYPFEQASRRPLYECDLPLGLASLRTRSDTASDGGVEPFA
jgi:hypothetical protein